ncbi:MAG: crossover junction endodeoxyribonuclease RuvC [Gammaproteobacteria bacterium]|jgi:crossover junction endodeoxyribonuclease RuvC|nr:crossover junction endodeoxyribonuclease RuvC [Gammaproteobacteria bacterium]
MIIMGLDPGSRLTGYGVIDSQKSHQRYIASGTIRLGLGEVSERLSILYEALQTLVARYQPDNAAIEQVFLRNNPAVAIKLGQARGSAITALAVHQIPVAEYSPRQIKQAVVGYGNSTKEQVQHMIVRLLQLPNVPAVDAADALAVALCHHFTNTGLQGLQGVKRISRGRLQ